MAPDTELLEYATERDDSIGYRTHLDEDWERCSLVERPNRPVEMPGEAWTQNRTNQQWFGLGTDEALERWCAASEVSREWRIMRQKGSR